MSLISMEKLFLIAGYKYQDLAENSWIDVSNKNIQILCFDHYFNKQTRAKILKLVRKENSQVFELRDLDGNLLLQATTWHKVFDPTTYSYVALGSIKKTDTIHLLDKKNRIVSAKVFATNKTSPILDMEVEDKHNYYSNDILSHNTVSGGNALRFYASQRLDIRKIDNIKTSDEQIGIRSRVKVVKNKVGAPFRIAEFNIMFGTGIDWAMDLLDSAVQAELINKSGAWFSYKGNNIGQGSSNTAQAIRDNEELANELKELLTNSKVAIPVDMEVSDE